MRYFAFRARTAQIRAIRRIIQKVAAAAVLSLVACIATQAADYSVNLDWSDAANPNGVWKYREGSNALPHVGSWQSSLGGWSSPQPAWAESENANNRLPVWFKSNGSENFTHDWLAGDVIIHSTDGFNGIGNGNGNLLWTSPEFGIATVSGGVWLGRDIGRAVNWSLLKDGFPITGGSLSSGDAFNRANPFLFSAGSGGPFAVNDVNVSPGTTLELRFTTASSSGGDFVGVDLNLGVDTFGIPGDYNDDGKADAADYVVWRKYAGTNTVLPNDPHGGAIGANQFNTWRANFGNTYGGSGGSGVEDPPLDDLEPSDGGSGGASSLNIVPGGTQASSRLNADGNWVWKVQISTSNPIPSGSSPLAAELGFKVTGSALLDANNLSAGAGDDFDTVTPGTPIWGWENPGTGTNGFPEGLQSNCASGLCTENTPGYDPNSIFAALGSQIYGSPTTADFIEIIAQGPSTTGSLTTNVSMSGVYGVGSNKGRVAEWNPAPPPDSINHDIYTGTFSYTALAGDANLDGSVDLLDYGIWLSNVGSATNIHWQHADFNNDNIINDADYNVWLDGTFGDYNFDGVVDAGDYVVWRKSPAIFDFTQRAYGVWRTNFGETGGAGAGGLVGSGAAVPEPAGMTLLLIGLLSSATMRRRRRAD